MASKPKVQAAKLPYVGRVASYLNDTTGRLPSGIRGTIAAPLASPTSAPTQPKSSLSAFAGQLVPSRITTLGGVN